MSTFSISTSDRIRGFLSLVVRQLIAGSITSTLFFCALLAKNNHWKVLIHSTSCQISIALTALLAQGLFSLALDSHWPIDQYRSMTESKVPLVFTRMVLILTFGLAFFWLDSQL